MYKIAILDEDQAYLERLIFFLKEHHGESFEISAVSCLDGECECQPPACNRAKLLFLIDHADNRVGIN